MFDASRLRSFVRSNRSGKTDAHLVPWMAGLGVCLACASAPATTRAPSSQPSAVASGTEGSNAAPTASAVDSDVTSPKDVSARKPQSPDCERAAERDRKSVAAPATRGGKPTRKHTQLSGATRQEYIAVLEATLNFKDFSRFSTELESSGQAVTLVLADGLPEKPGVTAFGRPVYVWSEERCLREMVLTFFEVKSIAVEGDRATLEYSFPHGAHFGTLTLQRRASGWVVVDKEAIRSSDGRRTRLAAFYARVPKRKIPDSEVRSNAAELCREGDVEGCYERGIQHHNAGRLEKAEEHYGKACAQSHDEACHNRAMLLVQLGRTDEGLCLLKDLCDTEGISLSCRMYDKYGPAAEPPPEP